MAKSEIASVIDRILVETVAPSLKVAKMRKQGRHWSDSNVSAVRGVTVQANRFNFDGVGSFTIDVGVSYSTLGHRAPVQGAHGAAISHRLSGLADEGRDVWFEFDVRDPASIELAQSAVDTSWRTLGLPFVHAAAFPDELCQHVMRTGNVFVALDVLENVAVLLKSERLEAELLGRATRYATARTRWRYVDNDPHPLELGLDVWATIFRHHERLRRQLQADERQAALAVLRDAEAGCLATRYHSEQDEEDAMFLAKELGVQAPVFGGS